CRCFGVERHGDGAEAGHGVVGKNESGGVSQGAGDAVPVADPEPRQGAREPADALPNLVVRQDTVVEMKRAVFWSSLSGLEQDLGEGPGAPSREIQGGQSHGFLKKCGATGRG